MNALSSCLLLAAGCAAFSLQTPDWTFETNPLRNLSENMKTFFEEQKNLVERAFDESYREAVRMKNSVSDYLDDIEREIGADINNYVEDIKESGRRVTDARSYLGAEEAGARMELPDAALSVPAVLTRHGYACETHTVASRGYMLGVHRIPRGRAGAPPRRAVILQHGLFASSADWVLNGPGKGLAYVLADAGYDVWMPNIRGNRYSKEHADLKNDSKSFWNFSWHDVALYDLPAVIDHVLRQRGEGAEVAYVGHSMGTTVLFAMLSLRPEYNAKLKAGLALAPVAFLSDIRSPVRALAPIASDVAYMQMLSGSHEFIPKDSVLGRMTNSCDADDADSVVCKNVIFYICGYNEKQFNGSLLPVFLAHLGTGTSWKTAVHFAQEILAGGRFQRFDYGKTDNLKVYGTESPPEYDLSGVTLPIKLFWAENDLLSGEKDVQLLLQKLPSTTEVYKVPDPEFNHLDYLWAIDAPALVNKEVLQTLEKAFSSESGDRLQWSLEFKI